MESKPTHEHNNAVRHGGLFARMLFSGAGLAGIVMLSRLFS